MVFLALSTSCQQREGRCLMEFYANHSNIPASSSVSSIFLALMKVRGTNQRRSQVRIRETTDGDVFAFPSSWSEQHNRCFAFIFSRVRSDIWRYGRQRGTKSQGQISWLCRDNSWEEQTRKSFHFIKDSAWEQQSFPTSPRSHDHSTPPPSYWPIHTRAYAFPHYWWLEVQLNMAPIPKPFPSVQ